MARGNLYATKPGQILKPDYRTAGILDRSVAVMMTLCPIFIPVFVKNILDQIKED